MYLQWMLYDRDSDLHHSDQITVHLEVWKQFDLDHLGDGPIFVDIGGAVGRLHPAVCGLSEDSCQIPDWMWRLADPDPGSWLHITACQPLIAEKIVLRAHHEETLTKAEDPVVMLTAALCGDDGHSWAVLNVGQLLSLSCGEFDVVGLTDASGSDIYVGGILNTDVRVEFVPALDYMPPIPVPVPAPAPAPVVAPVLQTPMVPPQQRPGGHIPFSGVGRRLG